jgi:spermidine synthase
MLSDEHASLPTNDRARPADPPQEARTRADRRRLFLLAFGAGFAVLTIEIAGARLIAPVFGLSVVPWTAVIGVILAALAVGSHLGGRLADAGRIPLSTVLMYAGVTCALPVAGAGVPWWARELLGFIPGAVASALILFAPPVLCLGAVVPYLVKADTESLGSVGRRAGDMSAAATAGSIAGSFTTGFVLLPALPLPALLAVTAGSLFLMAGLSSRVLGRGPPDARLLRSALGVGVLGLVASVYPTDTLHRQQTLYSSVQVTERAWADGRIVREMWQNGGSSSAEYTDTDEPAHLYAIASLAHLAPVLARSESLLVLGGAALTLPVAFQARRPGLRIDVVEVDPVVTDLAAEYFAYGKRPYPNVTVVHEAGRVFLRRTETRYDIVYLDVFDHLLTVPWTMVTAEALTDMSARLAPGGVFAANVLSPLAGPGTEFLARFRATLDEVFPEVRVYMTSPDLDRDATQNLIVLASNEAGALPHVDALEAPVAAAGRPLTDAWAPVEYLQAKVFAGGLKWR